MLEILGSLRLQRGFISFCYYKTPDLLQIRGLLSYPDNTRQNVSRSALGLLLRSGRCSLNRRQRVGLQKRM